MQLYLLLLRGQRYEPLERIDIFVPHLHMTVDLQQPLERLPMIHLKIVNNQSQQSYRPIRVAKLIKGQLCAPAQKLGLCFRVLLHHDFLFHDAHERRPIQADGIDPVQLIQDIDAGLIDGQELFVHALGAIRIEHLVLVDHRQILPRLDSLGSITIRIHKRRQLFDRLLPLFRRICLNADFGCQLVERRIARIIGPLENTGCLAAQSRCFIQVIHGLQELDDILYHGAQLRGALKPVIRILVHGAHDQAVDLLGNLTVDHARRLGLLRQNPLFDILEALPFIGSLPDHCVVHDHAEGINIRPAVNSPSHADQLRRHVKRRRQGHSGRHLRHTFDRLPQAGHSKVEQLDPGLPLVVPRMTDENCFRPDPPVKDILVMDLLERGADGYYDGKYPLVGKNRLFLEYLCQELPLEEFVNHKAGTVFRLARIEKLYGRGLAGPCGAGALLDKLFECLGMLGQGGGEHLDGNTVSCFHVLRKEHGRSKITPEHQFSDVVSSREYASNQIFHENQKQVKFGMDKTLPLRGSGAFRRPRKKASFSGG